MAVRDEIIRRVSALPVELQQRVLAYCDAIARDPIQGEAGRELLTFAGTLDHAAAREMSEAIEAGCENIDPREW